MKPPKRPTRKKTTAKTVPTFAAMAVAPAAGSEPGERRAQDAAAVHREGRDHVEQGEADVGDEEPAPENFDHRAVPADGPGRDAIEPHHAANDRGNSDIHHGARERDGDLPARFARDALEAGDAADGVEDDAAGADAELAGGEGVAELVQRHAAEEGEQHADVQDRGGEPAAQERGDEDEGRQQPEGTVERQADAERPTDICGLEHG